MASVDGFLAVFMKTGYRLFQALPCFENCDVVESLLSCRCPARCRKELQ
jgi:hypothetical protein